MGLWCEGFPTVAVPKGDRAKRITLVYPYFENRAFFGAQIRHWMGIPDPMRQYVSVIVVDDGSPTHPAEDVAKYFGALPFLRLFRIDVNVRWNWLAARNIGAYHAEDGSWLLMTDMDHVVPTDTIWSLVFGDHDPSVAYAFARREHTGVSIHPHSASFFLTKAMYWRIGGYDETLSGHYGTDGMYRRELAKHARIKILNDSLIRHEYQGDSSTEGLKRKDPADKDQIRALVAKRGKGWTPKVLSFPYHEVAA
jgi:hypothetical protein